MLALVIFCLMSPGLKNYKYYTDTKPAMALPFPSGSCLKRQERAFAIGGDRASPALLLRVGWSVIGNEVVWVAHTAIGCSVTCHSTTKRGANHIDVGEGSDGPT